jgi:Flp pilus assembly protein TadD
MRPAALCVSAVIAVLFLPLAVPAAAAPRESPAAVQAARLCVELRKEAAVAACRTALALGPSGPRAAVVRDVLASRLASLDRWEEVVAVYREAATDPGATAATHVRLGSALLHGVGRPEEALAWLREAARLDPADAEPWGVLGAALAALGRPDEATAAFDEAVRRDPSWLERHPASQAVAGAARKGEAWP